MTFFTVFERGETLLFGILIHYGIFHVCTLFPKSKLSTVGETTQKSCRTLYNLHKVYLLGYACVSPFLAWDTLDHHIAHIHGVSLALAVFSVMNRPREEQLILGLIILFHLWSSYSSPHALHCLVCASLLESLDVLPLRHFRRQKLQTLSYAVQTVLLCVFLGTHTMNWTCYVYALVLPYLIASAQIKNI